MISFTMLNYGTMNQKIVVFLGLGEYDANLIPYGVGLATVFRKELCLFYHATGVYQADKCDLQLKEYRYSVQNHNPTLPVSILIAPFRKDKLAAVLSDEHEAILMVVGSSSFRRLSQSLQNSPIPFLFVNEKKPANVDFSRIFFPVDLRKQNKDAMKWIFYFGRYAGSEIIVIGAEDKWKSYREQVTSNLTAIKKNLLKYGINHKIYRGSRGSLGIHNEGFEAASRLHAGMMVLLGSSVFTLLDLILGLPEEKIVRRAKETAILVINPRRETYLVCE